MEEIRIMLVVVLACGGLHALALAFISFVVANALVRIEMNMKANAMRQSRMFAYLEAILESTDPEKAAELELKE